MEVGGRERGRGGEEREEEGEMCKNDTLAIESCGSAEGSTCPVQEMLLHKPLVLIKCAITVQSPLTPFPVECVYSCNNLANQIAACQN